MKQEQTKTNTDPWEKEFKEFGQDTAKRVKEWVETGKVRRVVIRKSDNDVLLDVPMMPAVVVAGVMTFWMPYLTLLAVIVAFATRLKLEIVRTEVIDDTTESVEVTS